MFSVIYIDQFLGDVQRSLKDELQKTHGAPVPQNASLQQNARTYHYC